MILNLRVIIRFRGLQNYTTLKRHGQDGQGHNGFRGLQNYTTLKLLQSQLYKYQCFRGLQNYTTLKQAPL